MHAASSCELQTCRSILPILTSAGTRRCKAAHQGANVVYCLHKYFGRNLSASELKVGSTQGTKNRYRYTYTRSTHVNENTARMLVESRHSGAHTENRPGRIEFKASKSRRILKAMRYCCRFIADVRLPPELLDIAVRLSIGWVHCNRMDSSPH